MSSDRQLNIVAGAAIASCAVLIAGPRRARPLAGVAYGIALSHGQRLSRERLEATLVRLFDERTSIGRRLDGLAEECRAAHAALTRRVERLDGR